MVRGGTEPDLVGADVDVPMPAAVESRWHRSKLPRPWGHVAVVAVAMVGARLAAYAAGVRFDASPRQGFWQYLDASMLDADPLSSLWHLHTQPPLFNAYLWFSESVSPFGLVTTTRLTFQLLGVALALLSWHLARELGLSRRASTVVSIVVVANPATLIYENWLYTTYPTTVLTVALALAGARVYRRRSVADLAMAAAAGAGLVLLRSVFHPLWFLVTIGALALPVLRAGRGARTVLVAVAVPTALVGGLLLKNLVLFDMAGTSSWTGMSLAKLTIDRLEPDSRLDLVARGVLDPVSAVGAFQPFGAYTAVGVPPAAPTGIPVLDNVSTASGAPNLNYRGYLEVERRLRADALTVIRRDPGLYAGAVARAARVYVGPPTCYAFTEINERHLSTANKVWRIVFYGEVPYGKQSCPHLEMPSRYSNPGWTVVAALGAIAVVLAGGVLGRGRFGRWARRYPGVLFAAALVLYSGVLTSMLELGENQRFRVEVEPLLIVLVAWLLAQMAGITGSPRSLHRRRLPSTTQPGQHQSSVEPFSAAGSEVPSRPPRSPALWRPAMAIVPSSP